GPAALAFPDIEFLIYHSAYEMPTTGEVEEGPWTEETRDIGVNRLVTTLRDSKIAPGSNVYAELGSTWFCLIRRPDEAAHVLGKLLLAVGEDNILWGSDSIWFGPTQPAIDALRTFQIPLALREEFGYPELTPQIKAKILGLNAARVYGVDPQRARERSRSDDMAWVRSALDEYDARGIPSL
ncbi:MAG: amidohydrolase family protein, partial [Deltaproteobacteria bacterium]|nr:amidohydrolase family protein [Deltaproteobacteria bacterium]